MFNYLKGYIKGRKVAMQASMLVQKIVNYLLTSGVKLKINDTIKILQESYSYCHALNDKPPSSDIIVGTSLYTSDSIIKEWLIKMYKPLDDSPDTLEYIESSLSTLQPYYNEWFRELGKDHPEYIGKPHKEWVPLFNSRYAINVAFYLDTVFPNGPKQLSSFILDLTIITSKKYS